MIKKTNITEISHSIFLMMYFIFTLYSQNFNTSIHMYFIIEPLLQGLFFVLFLYIIFYMWIRNIRKVSMIVSLFLLLFFSYGHILELLSDLDLKLLEFFLNPHTNQFRNRYLMPLFILLLCGGTYTIIKTRLSLLRIKKFLNIFSFTLLLLSIINVLSCEFASWRDNEKLKKISEHQIKNIPQYDTENIVKRDIYYIILDAYTSKDVLENIFEYDNSDLLNYLEEKGFYIAEKSTCNYSHTNLSVSSSLNLRYHDYLSDIFKKDHPNEILLWDMIKNSTAADFLKKNGYKIIFMNSNVNLRYNSYADIEFAPTQFRNNFTHLIYSTTIMRPFMDKLLQSDKQKRINYLFEKLKEIPAIKGNKFVFAHILCPHFPYVFDENGDATPLTETQFCNHHNVEIEHNRYKQQLIFLNKQIKKIIDSLLSQYTVKPIIILQGDHGPAALLMGSDWPETLTDNMLKEKMSILNAYYLPGSKKPGLYKEISPVNTFRVIFNHYFNTKLELEEDTAFFSYLKGKYKFIDVTDIVKD